jgi:hypothetical protein
MVGVGRRVVPQLAQAGHMYMHLSYNDKQIVNARRMRRMRWRIVWSLEPGWM